MASNKPPGRKITGIRGSIPSGYILGRTSFGEGDVELLTQKKLQSAGLVPVTLPPSGAAGGDLTGTYPNPTVAKINTQTLPAPTSTAFAVLMYSGGNLAWVNQRINGGSTGTVATKNSGTDFDISWATPHYLIAGGTAGQVLTKNSSTDYDVSWVTPSAGGSGSAASSFFLDGTHGYIAEVDSNGLLVLDSMGRGIYSVDPVLPTAMIPNAVGYVTGPRSAEVVGKVKGVTDGSAAAAGDVGELLASIVPFASGITPANNTGADVTTLALTAGDWDVSGAIAFFSGNANANSVAFGISQTANTLPSVSTDVQGSAEISVTLTGGASNIFAIAPFQVNVSVGVTMHLVIFASFTGGGTQKAWGTIRVRRVR